jgi:hypothetical protein
VDGLWRRVAAAIATFEDGISLSDLHLRSENLGPVTEAFMRGLGAFVRGAVELHFADEAEAQAALREAGFADATLHRPADFADRIEVGGRGSELVRVIDATPA